MNKEKKSIFIVLSFSLLFSFPAFANKEEKSYFSDFSLASLKNPSKNIFHLIQNVSLIKKDDLFGILREFINSAKGTRLIGTSGHELARGFIEEAIRKLDSEKKGLMYLDKFQPDVESAVSFYETSFKEKIENKFSKTSETYEQGRRFTSSIVDFIKEKKDVEGRNIIWEKKGSLRPDDLLVITAHYDTVVYEKERLKASSSMPGADDNASGVAIGLALLKLFSHMDIPITVRIVFLDWEEFGSLGSKAFVTKYRKEVIDKNLLGFINLEMLGHDSKAQDKEERHGNMRIYIKRPGTPYYETHNSLAVKLLNKGKKIEKSMRFKVIANDQNLEGNVSFWEPSWPGVTFSQNWQDDPNLTRNHTPNDFAETLNSKTLHQSYRFIAGAILAFAYDF
ncbi:MAG: M28 family peptidase [Bacteriovoracaceae bacterium]|nr:M28 family peptidase [Bacteriovoracaceae bacterium]